MITEEEVMRLLERADPAPRSDTAAVLDAAGYLDTLRTRSTTVTLIDTTPTRERPPRSHRWRIIAAVAAAAALLVTGVVVLARHHDEPEVPGAPAITEPTVRPEVTAALATARAFAAAWPLEPDQMISQASDEAIAAEWGSAEELRLLSSFLAVTGSRTTNIDCQPMGSSAHGTDVHCSYESPIFRSNELGFGPYTHHWDLTIRDGTIVALSQSSDENGFSVNIWEPLRDWVLAEHPGDFPTMYDGSGWRITPESIPLWEQRVKEYVATHPPTGLIGLPPEGAVPSEPEDGRLVDSYFVQVGDNRNAGFVRLYADGRLIWRMYYPAETFNRSTGWVEQRLNTDAVELVRTHQSAAEKNPLRLHEWLPASAWDDELAKPFVPSSYAACLGLTNPGGPPVVDPEVDLVELLPAPAADLLRGRPSVPQGPDAPRDGWGLCPGLTIDEARLLDRALAEAGATQRAETGASLLEYNVDYPDQSNTRLVIAFEPVFPDGTVGCSGCG